MQLVKFPYTNKVILTEDREIFVTERQFRKIEDQKINGKASDLIEIRDENTNELKYYGELRAIKEFKEIKKQESNGDGYYCDFGVFHELSRVPYGECECEKLVGCNSSKFLLNMHSIGITMINGLVNGEKPLTKDQIKKYKEIYYLKK